MGRSRKRKHNSNFNNENIEQKGGGSPESDLVYKILESKNTDKDIDELLANIPGCLQMIGNFFKIKDNFNNNNITLFLNSINSESIVEFNYFNVRPAWNITYNEILKQFRTDVHKKEIIKILHKNIHETLNTATYESQKKQALLDLFNNTTTMNMLKENLDADLTGPLVIKDNINTYYGENINDPETFFQKTEDEIRDIITVLIML